MGLWTRSVVQTWMYHSSSLIIHLEHRLNTYVIIVKPVTVLLLKPMTHARETHARNILRVSYWLAAGYFSHQTERVLFHASFSYKISCVCHKLKQQIMNMQTIRFAYFLSKNTLQTMPYTVKCALPTDHTGLSWSLSPGLDENLRNQTYARLRSPPTEFLFEHISVNKSVIIICIYER